MFKDVPLEKYGCGVGTFSAVGQCSAFCVGITLEVGVSELFEILESIYFEKPLSKLLNPTP